MKKGARVLGSVKGSETECKTFLETQLEEHNKILKKLDKIAKTSPQNVYSSYTKGVQEKLSFLARTIFNTTENMQACEKVLQENLIPNLFGKDNISHQFRDIASLPLKIGGLSVKLPSDHKIFLEWSIKISSVLDTYDPLTAISEQEKIYTKIKTLKTEKTNEKIAKNLNNLSEKEKYALELASKKGALNYLNALLLSRYNFNLAKSEFRDGNYLRYGCEPNNIPLHMHVVHLLTLPTPFLGESCFKARAVSLIQPQLIKTLD